MASKKKNTIRLPIEGSELLRDTLTKAFREHVPVPLYAPSQALEEENSITITDEQRAVYADSAALCASSLDKLDDLEGLFKQSCALRRKVLVNSQHKLLIAISTGQVLDPNSQRAREDHWKEERAAEKAEEAEAEGGEADGE